MKRTLSLILALAVLCTCALALSACGGEEKTVYEFASELNPTKTVTFVEYKTASGDKLNGEYVMEKSGADAIFTYSYQRYRTAEELIADKTNERIKTFEGAVYCKDGKYSADGKTWGSSPVPSEIALNLKEEYLTNAVLSEDGNTLTAEIAADKLEAVLGVAIEAEGNVLLTAVANGTYLTGITVSCTTKSGSSVVIRTSYSYNRVELEFPSV